MTRASQRRKTLRADPPVTMMNPAEQRLALVDSAGDPLEVLECGHSDGKFTYCWVDKSNDRQFSTYQAMGFGVCRRDHGGAKPKFDVYIDEGDTKDTGGVITRAEMILMRRPLETSQAYLAGKKQASEDRRRQMGLHGRDLNRRAAAASMKVQAVDIDSLRD